VILDGSLPSRQREAFIQASGAEIIVTDSARPFPGRSSVRYYAASGEDRDLAPRTGADQWACVTADKARSHEAVLTILDSAREQQGFRDGDAMFSAAELSGQAAIDLFLPLISGGRLVLASKQELRDLNGLDKVIEAANCKFVSLPKVGCQPAAERRPAARSAIMGA
jgi:hypothetical protein